MTLESLVFLFPYSAAQNIPEKESLGPFGIIALQQSGNERDLEIIILFLDFRDEETVPVMSALIRMFQKVFIVLHSAALSSPGKC